MSKNLLLPPKDNGIRIDTTLTIYSRYVSFLMYSDTILFQTKFLPIRSPNVPSSIFLSTKILRYKCVYLTFRSMIYLDNCEPEGSLPMGIWRRLEDTLHHSYYHLKKYT